MSITRKTWHGFLKTWRGIADAGRAVTGDIHADIPRGDKQRLIKQFQDCLNARGGEVSARQQAVSLGRLYVSLSAKGRTRFLQVLADEFSLDTVALATAVTSWQQAEEGAQKHKAQLALQQSLIAPRATLLRQFSSLPDGLKFLVDMRADLLPLARKDVKLKALDADFKQLLAAWFDVGLLEMRRIDWNAPASLLEKLIEYEAVHEITSWSDLKNRLDSDRRCFAFFHPNMPHEPLIFVEVALVNEVGGNLQHILDEDQPVHDPAQASTALFYSISNAQEGLKGIQFGNFLIKQVVAELSHECPQLKHFATLSPMPTFRRWAEAAIEEGAWHWTKDEAQQLNKLKCTDVRELWAKDDWVQNSVISTTLEPIIMRMAAHYLINETRNGNSALDPVAHFHLTNGAKLQRINWLANTNKAGLKQSLGLMVNYVYELNHIEEHHEQYAGSTKVATSRQVKAWLA